MNNSPDIIKAIQEKHPENGVPCSVYRVAKLLKAEQSMIYSVMAGRRSLPKSLLIPASELLGVEAGALAAITAAEREKDLALRASLLRVGNGAMTAALAFALAVPMAVAKALGCILCKITQAWPCHNRLPALPVRYSLVAADSLRGLA